MDAEYSEQYEDDTEEKLVIVGALDDNNLYIMISESGKVYCDTGKLGDNFEEAWDNMLIPGRSPVAWQFL
ncbi:SUKH-3 domain-containing protein [Clostridium perfringens]|uniref:SUKH-3 domain-containing protein n=1 Tax=Clostridium perfringens TaxID=1502 RepID=UPI0024BC4275|nr:SUKH-3 domain-containing protein [Clostridium perfringens]